MTQSDLLKAFKPLLVYRDITAKEKQERDWFDFKFVPCCVCGENATYFSSDGKGNKKYYCEEHVSKSLEKEFKES